jgi:hypothetical protein
MVDYYELHSTWHNYKVYTFRSIFLVEHIFGRLCHLAFGMIMRRRKKSVNLKIILCIYIKFYIKKKNFCNNFSDFSQLVSMENWKINRKKKHFVNLHFNFTAYHYLRTSHCKLLAALMAAFKKIDQKCIQYTEYTILPQ